MSATMTKPETSPAHQIEELGRIIMAYSEVTEKLQQSHERLEQTVTTLRDELSDKNRQLERKTRLAALGEMAAGLAHEIRNPLGGIQLYASILAKDVQDRPESLQVVKKISNGVKRLESLVGQVLQFTREMSVQVRPMELRQTIEQAVDLASQQMEERGIRCEIEGPAAMEVRADPIFIGQAVLNLVLNAVDAMEPEGKLKIEFGVPADQMKEKQFCLVVQDSGPGIPAAILDRIFNPFFTTKETGTGLGLAIVHRIVEAHDGTIAVSNPAEGGARFEIRI